MDNMYRSYLSSLYDQLAPHAVVEAFLYFIHAILTS